MGKKVILGMSGGVDSSVCAVLLKEQGYSVTGLFMKNWDEKDPSGVCTATEDYEDVMRVAGELDIPFYTVNFEKEYFDNVFSNFLKEYEKGRTPNPDVMCNQEIKFNAFLKYALSLDADYIAMGHYARTKEINERTYLLKGMDLNKDQSYFLSSIDETALKKTLFPIGEMQKYEVRKIAQKYNLATKNKKDSTGICFIGERNFNLFLDKFLQAERGDIYSVEGEYLGEHSGLIHYTIGQRRGIGIGGKGNGEPWFVAGKNLKRNILYVAQGASHPALYTNTLYADNVHWITETPVMPKKCTAKFRYRQKDIEVEISMDKNRLKVAYAPQMSVTPGQVAVFYDKDICMGSAIIDYAEPTDKKYEFLHTT